MHCVQNLDEYACYAQTGKPAVGNTEDRWGWRSPHVQPGESFPSQAELVAMLAAIRDVAMPAIEAATDDELLRPRAFWTDKSAYPTDKYMRTICHTMSHVRQIWLLRGALGLTDGKAFPRQHWA